MYVYIAIHVFIHKMGLYFLLLVLLCNLFLFYLINWTSRISAIRDLPGFS